MQRYEFTSVQFKKIGHMLAGQKKSRVILLAITMFCLEIAGAANRITLNYIPRMALFTPPEVLAVKISPDSKYLAYVKSTRSGVMNIFLSPDVEPVSSHSLKQLTHFNTPEIYKFFWTGDSKSIVFVKDNNGLKSPQLFTINIVTGELKNYTKNFKGVSAKIFKIAGSKIAVGINDRNPNFYDVYIVDTTKGTLTKIYRNDQYSKFIFDDNLKIAFKEKNYDDGSTDIIKDNKTYMHFSPNDAFHSRIIGLNGQTLYFVDSRNSNTTWLKSIDLNTSTETKLAHNSKSDIGDIIFTDRHPSIYSTTWLKKEWHALVPDKPIALPKKFGGDFEVTSESKKYYIIRAYDVKKLGTSFYLYNRNDETIKPLFIPKTHPLIAETIPFEFRSRDGLMLIAYITLPSEIKSLASITKPLPLIVFPHGGPFQARDSIRYDPYREWLASRGYAVLNVNFRSSSGLGKNLVQAGNGEWGRKAQFDLIDGVNWCIKKGITTQNQVGIMGGSYGGYATLAALAFTPKQFAVGVAIAGPSSLVTLMKKLPNYWDFPSYPLSDSELFFTKGAFINSMGANVNSSEGLKLLTNRSPLNYSTKIERPILLIKGDNDPIVTKEESQQIFNKLNQLHKRTMLISFSDEGHQFRRYANIDVALAYSEKWLHDVLGGRFEPINTELMKQSSANIQTAKKLLP